MTDDGKKVSFGFAKSIKKSALKTIPPRDEKKIDYIECLDDKSIKIVGVEKKPENFPLVIPLLGSKTWHERILNKTDADIFDAKIKDVENASGTKIANSVDDDRAASTDASKNEKDKNEKTDNAPKTLDERAAGEMLEDLRRGDVKAEGLDLEVPTTENGVLHGQRESTLEDYEQIPIDAFGLAMLRGMGWKPGEGIGKNAKFVATTLPELRPKGMGLGADKASLQKRAAPAKVEEEERLKLEKGCFVKIIAGKLTNNYGRIEGFDDEAGRLIVKMALAGESRSLNEHLVRPVTKSEYTANSKVLNVAKYEEYKKREANTERDETCDSAFDDGRPGDEKMKKHRDEDAGNVGIAKKNRKRSKRESDESSDSERVARKRGDSSDGDRRYEKINKLKKNDERDALMERSRKKNKKRDKRKDKLGERKSEHLESSDRKKRKKRKRSRSRSPRRR